MTNLASPGSSSKEEEPGLHVEMELVSGLDRKEMESKEKKKRWFRLQHCFGSPRVVSLSLGYGESFGGGKPEPPVGRV